MHVVERHRGLHGVAHLQHIVDGSGSIVGMAGPVDLSGLGHQEEALFVVQQLNALADIVRQLPLTRGSIHGVIHGFAVGQVLRNDEGLARTGGQGSRTRLGGNDIVACLGSHFMVVGHSAVAVHFLELAACKVFKAGVCQLHADVVVIFAAFLVGIERCRGSVVDVDRGNDADFVASLLVQLLGNGLIGHITGPGAHVDDAALGLVAGGDGSRGGSRIRAERSAVVGGHAAHFWELGEAQLRLGDCTVVGRSALIEPGRLDLSRAHAVADEQEHILGLFAKNVQHPIFLILCLHSRGSRSIGGHRSGGHHADSRSQRTGLEEIAAGHFTLFHNTKPLFSRADPGSLFKFT